MDSPPVGFAPADGSQAHPWLRLLWRPLTACISRFLLLRYHRLERQRLIPPSSQPFLQHSRSLLLYLPQLLFRPADLLRFLPFRFRYRSCPFSKKFR